jgi:hypothetical protein
VYGPDNNGLAAFLFLKRNKVKLGEEIPVCYGLMLLDNAEPIKIWPADDATKVPIDHSYFAIKDPDEEGVHFLGPAVDGGPQPDPNTAVTLQPGQLHGRHCSNLLKGYRTITKPGVYTVVWHYNIFANGGLPEETRPFNGHLESNEIKILVEP